MVLPRFPLGQDVGMPTTPPYGSWTEVWAVRERHAETLTVISDRSGWWDLYRLDTQSGAAPEPLCPL